MAGNEISRIKKRDIETISSQHSELSPARNRIGERVVASTGGTFAAGLLGAIGYSFVGPENVNEAAMLLSVVTMGSAGGMVALARTKASEFNHWLKNYAGLAQTPKAKGLWKTFLPFGRTVFPYAYQVEGKMQKSQDLMDIRYHVNHKVNTIPVVFTVKHEEAGVMLYHKPIVNPMNSWDKLFFEETGYSINEKRSDTVEYYKRMNDPTKAEILSARIAKSVNHIRNVETPLWVEEIASKDIR